MLVDTARVSVAWQPLDPQVSGATRKSPGFTNFIYSYDSFSHAMKTRSGTAVPFLNTAFFGCTCAFSFIALYSGELVATPTARLAEKSPPWQSTHASCTVLVGCIVGSSVAV